MSTLWRFTSESVTEGHPDKLADRLSDAVLDAHLRKDPYARVACESLAGDRSTSHRSLVNSCFSGQLAQGRAAEPGYGACV